MMKHEFEKIAGYEVSEENYSVIIEPMYMAVKLDKEEFVKTIDKTRFALKTKAELMQEMKKIAKHLKDTCEKYTDYAAEDRLKGIAEEYKKRFAPNGGFFINTRYTLEYLGECRGCGYPAEFEVYDSKYHTVEKIKIA